ncbi:hypothetical protein Y024_269 [Burkholderia pseudomallei TSV44]|uniref:DUF2971 domain-containing protein n=1 Tax=Burkholderia pseudomallei TaxID=28450 RepID=UPI00050EDF6D|nr:DUF2971 domain-containing protein [Burkholderia pseudomallei]KGC58723.1 hypothetical protein DP56_1482 [Burkholderia pseudomallei]KGX65355.1 hypothetical protein Y024_269 [Burkholderia pseudomallei TSV44]
MTNLVYRYANASTFLSMLHSQELWFTDLRQMNDWNEYEAGFRIASEIIACDFPELTAAIEAISPDKMDPYFMILICSFGSLGDCLSMWRGYGDNCYGAAIGYDPKKIQDHCMFGRYLTKRNPISGKVLFLPVIYDDQAYRSMLRQYIQSASNQLKNLSGEDANVHAAVHTRTLKIALMRLCTLYKDHFFADEREIRGFIEINAEVDPYKLQVRQSEFGEATYHRLDTNFQNVRAIEEVVLGPLCTLTEMEVRNKLVENGLDGVVIRRSRGAGAYR